MCGTSLREAATEVHCVVWGVSFSLEHDRALEKESSQKSKGFPDIGRKPIWQMGPAVLQDILRIGQISWKALGTRMAKSFAYKLCVC